MPQHCCWSTARAEDCSRRFFVLLLVIGVLTLSFMFKVMTSAGFIGESDRTYDRGLLKHPLVDVIEHGRDTYEDRSVADELARKVRVLCWVMTQPNNHEKKARHVKATWGKRCNILLFMSSVEDLSLPTVKLPVHEGRHNLWGKTKAAFRYVYEHHRKDADWFLKADDDTYVIVENLRYMLAEYDNNTPIYFGCRFKPFTNQGFMSGGSGYVLSQRALDLFVHRGLPSPTLCKAHDLGNEDVDMGICLDNIGVKAMDSRDSFRRGRFLPFAPRDHLFPDKDKSWYWKYIYYYTNQGLDCCSDHAVSFHYVTPDYMYVLDYLIYHLRPFGINFANSELPRILRGNPEEWNESNKISGSFTKK